MRKLYLLIMVAMGLGCTTTKKSDRTPAQIAQEPSARLEEKTVGSRPFDKTRAKGAACAEDRWSVKTLTDPDALNEPETLLANFTKVKNGREFTTIDLLRTADYPPDWGANLEARAKGAKINELNIVKIKARIFSYKLEDDKDYHFAIVDPSDKRTTKSMIAESTDPSCGGPDNKLPYPAFTQILANVRDEIKAILVKHPKDKPPRKGKVYDLPDRINVEITGLVFFDKVHGQKGVNKHNGIEIHPIMDIVEMNSANAK